MVQERARGVALREHGYHETRVNDPRSEPRSSEQNPLQKRRCAHHPGETDVRAGHQGTGMHVGCLPSLFIYSRVVC